ncbi:MAG: M24 family metallopeptidase [Rhodopseudomonas sp.]|nr:M24 family metallopeptidase [Rhodopseudomonas sp.]
MQAIDFAARVRALAARLAADGVSAYVGTRQASLHYLCGTFMPWRGAVIVTADGHCEVAYWAMDAERIKAEGCPHPVHEFAGSGLVGLIARQLAAHGADRGRVGLDLSHPGAAQIAPGMLTAGEYLDLKAALPQVDLFNGVRLIDDLMLIKSPAEIERLRRAAFVADIGFHAGVKAIAEGITENHVAGVVEAAIRDHGSTWSWSVTGGTEVGAGERTAFLRGVTQQSTDRPIRRNEFVVIDLHPLIDLYMSDLSIPVFFGTPNDAQKRAIDCWETTVSVLLETLKPGRAVRDCVATAVAAFGRSEIGRQFGLPLFGHGLGTCARTRPFMNASSDDVLAPNMVIALGTHFYQPGVAGMRLEYPVLITPNGAEGLAPTPPKVRVLA